MNKSTFAEIHTFRQGLTEEQVYEDYLNNGSVDKMNELYCHRVDDEDYSMILSLLFYNQEGKAKLVIGDALDDISDTSSSLFADLQQFLGLDQDVLLRFLYMTLWPEEIPWREMEEEAYCASYGVGGEINTGDIDQGILMEMKDTCLLAISQYSYCDLEIKDDMPESAYHELVVSLPNDESEGREHHLDKLEAAKLYYGS